MHGIRGGNILLCTGIWCLTASAECCSPPLSQMPFSCAGKRVLLCSGEGWLLLVKMSDLSILFLQLWSLWHKTTAPKVVRLGVSSTVLLFPWENDVSRVGKWLRKCSSSQSSCSYKCYLEVQNNIFGTEEIGICSDKMMQISEGPSSDCSLEILAGLYPSWWSWGFAVFPLAG